MQERVLKEAADFSIHTLGAEFLGRLFSDSKHRFEMERSFSQTGAGALEKTADSTKHPEQREKLLKRLSFYGAVEELAEVYQVTLTVQVFKNEKTFDRDYVFHIPKNEQTDFLNVYIHAGKMRHTAEELERLFGISVKVKEYSIGEDPVEQRVQLIHKELGETQTLTVSHKDHWQNSHSHKTTAESYSLLQGVIVLVSQNPHSHNLHVRALSKTEEGWREVSFNFDPQTGRESDETLTDHSEAPLFATECNTAHNVFLSSNAVIATSKITTNTQQNKESGLDWHAEEGLDETLNSTEEDSDGNLGINHTEIVWHTLKRLGVR